MKAYLVLLNCAACLILSGCGLLNPGSHATPFGSINPPIPPGAVAIKSLAVTKLEVQQVPVSNSSLAFDFEPTQLTNIFISVYGTTNLADWQPIYTTNYPLTGGTMLIPITNNIAQSFFKVNYSINVPSYTGN